MRILRLTLHQLLRLETPRKKKQRKREGQRYTTQVDSEKVHGQQRTQSAKSVGKKKGRGGEGRMSDVLGKALCQCVCVCKEQAQP